MSDIALERRRIPVGTIILLALMALGLGVGIYRFALGLGASTNLSDSYPWGLWLGFDVITGVALGSGAFTMAAVVYIFNLKKFRPILRPALLTGFLGYILVIMGLLADLGQPWRLWHAIIYWNHHSVLFEVAWCVMLYTTVMFLELLPLVFERFNKPKALRAIHLVTLPLVIAGVTLSTLHQSSLGSLFMIMPDKLDPLWLSPILPIFFYISAIAVGLAMVIVESFLSAKAFKRGLEMDILSSLGRAVPFVLGLYLVFKLVDVTISGEFGLMFRGTAMSNLFLVEMVVGVILPIVLLSLSKVRRSPAGLFWSSVLVIAGLVFNRLVMTLVAPQGSVEATYFPTWMEFALTIGLVSTAVFAFMLIARFFPVFPDAEAEAH